MVPILLSFNGCPEYLDTHPVIVEAMVSVKLTRGCRSIAVELRSDQTRSKHHGLRWVSLCASQTPEVVPPRFSGD